MKALQFFFIFECLFKGTSKAHFISVDRFRCVNNNALRISRKVITMILIFLIIFGCFLKVNQVLCQCDDVSDVTFTVIRGDNLSHPNPLSVPWYNIKSLLKASYFDNNKPTLIYAHGFTENFTYPSVQIILNSYLLRRREFNLLFIDWSKYSSGNYILQAVPNLIKVTSAA